MSAPTCQRAWQVEAARDGRLRGRDLEGALRHQATCADCAREARELGELGQRLTGLPEAPRDPLTVRRSRQALMAAMNESLLATDQPSSARNRTLIAGCTAVVLAAAAWLLIVRARLPRAPAAVVDSKSIVDVHAGPGARWSEHVDSVLDRVSFTDGVAAFSVHPHPGRSVIVELPDGELEDMGTVFELRVDHEHTRHIAVTEGVVAVRFHGSAEFRLAAGQTWESNPILPTPEPDTSEAIGTTSPLATEAAAAPSGESGHAPLRSGDVATASASRRVATKAALASAAEPSAQAPLPSASVVASAKAEDDAYLAIVGLLRSAHYADARAAAKRYLLQFPNGFRRVEVLNIATRAEGDAGDSRDAQ